jgi:prephenate dehydrogenase
VVTSGGESDAAARVADFWAALGARVVIRDAAVHDAEVAWTSHLPHLVAFAFARALGQAPPGWREVVGGGFRDFSRIAHSDPELWADILTANRKAIAAPLEALGASLAEALEPLLADARRMLSGPDFGAASDSDSDAARSTGTQGTLREKGPKQGDRSTPHE